MLRNLLRVLTLLLVVLNSQTTPEAVITAVANAVFQYNNATCPFVSYNYGTAVIFDSMYSATSYFSSLDYNSLISPYLDYYLYDDKNSPAYQISNNIIIPWNSSDFNAIGDKVGLFPIIYLDRVLYYLNHSINNINLTSDWIVINTTANYYIVQFPKYLKDFTVSRDAKGNWETEQDGNHTFVWADDTYMGLTLLCRLYKYQLSKTDEINFILEQYKLFYKHLNYDINKYYLHGYNDLSGDQSCCPWGRANAWIFLSFVEIHKLLKYLNNDLYTNDILLIEEYLINQSIGLAMYQSDNGLWHQVINDSSTFLETSCSSGFVYGIIYCYINGLYDNITSNINWDTVIDNGWNGILSTVDINTGIVSGLCQGTGIQENVEEYNSRSTAYCLSGNPGGPGFVIHSAVQYQKYLDWKNK